MPIKSILLHMANDDRHSARLATAVALAKRFGAFVDVVYITTPIRMPATITGRGASYAYIGEATIIAHEKAEAIEHEVRHALKDCSYAWSVEEGDHVEILASRAAYADLAIVTQSQPAHLEDHLVLHVPDRLPLASPCPTLVLPYEMAGDADFGRHVLLAWKQTREATLAVRNAIPFLAAADKVTILTIERADDRREDRAHDLMVYLERQGVRSNHHAHVLKEDDVGDAILARVENLKADMVVMGAYGHSRLREIVLGGATRTVLRHMDVPFLMSH